MRTISSMQQLSMPAVITPAFQVDPCPTHHPVGQSALWAERKATPVASRLRVHGVRINAVAARQIAAVGRFAGAAALGGFTNGATYMGDVRGVPPRGRPV